MEKMHYLAMAACLLASVLMAPALAYKQPPVNLGYTSFMDGAPPAGPGFYFTEYVSVLHGRRFLRCWRSPPPGFDLDVWVSLNQFIYQSNTPVLFGGKWGLDVIVPVVWIDSRARAVLPDNSSGVGDILVGPYLQWDPIMGEKGPIFMHRVEFQMIFPSGSYDDDDGPQSRRQRLLVRSLLGGHLLHHAQVDGFRAIPLPVERRERRPVRRVSAWTRSRPAKPSTPTSPPPTRSCPGNCGWASTGTGSTRSAPPRASRRCGTPRPRDDEMVFAVGPGALLSFSQNTHLFFNAYFETETDYPSRGRTFRPPARASLLIVICHLPGT